MLGWKPERAVYSATWVRSNHLFWFDNAERILVLCADGRYYCLRQALSDIGSRLNIKAPQSDRLDLLSHIEIEGVTIGDWNQDGSDEDS
jgi:hypothetical protein